MTRRSPRSRHRSRAAAWPAALLLLGACATAGSPPASREPATPPGPETPGRKGYLAEGPAVALDATAGQSEPTTLQLLDERSKENAQLKAQLEDLERSVRAAEGRAQDAEKSSSSKAAELEQMRSLLERAIGEQKELTGEVLKTRLARLRAEQDLLKLRIAELVEGEGP